MTDMIWRGVFPAVTTPFLESGALDLEGFATQISRQLDAGVHGIVLGGSLGEASTLSPSEKLSLAKQALAVTSGRVPVLAGVADSSTLSACRFAEDLASLGVQGLMVLPPLNYMADGDECIGHFRQIADACGLDIMVYNNPVSYGIDVTPDQLAELAADPRFVAVKESSDDIRRLTDIRNLLDDRFQLFCGVDNLAFESLVTGADGWIAGLVCAYPRETVALYNLTLNGCLNEARKLYRWFMPLLHLDVSAKLVQNIKAAMAFEGCGNEVVRLPRKALTGEARTRVLGILEKAREDREQIEDILEMKDAEEVHSESQLC